MWEKSQAIEGAEVPSDYAVFEFWFIFVAGVKWFKPAYSITAWTATKWMVPILILKESQEYTLHWWRILDQYRAVDVVTDWWATIVGWL